MKTFLCVSSKKEDKLIFFFNSTEIYFNDPGVVAVSILVWFVEVSAKRPLLYSYYLRRGVFDSAKNHKRQRRKRQSVTAKRKKSQTPKLV